MQIANATMDSDNLLCMATSVMQVKITQCKQNKRVRYFHEYSLPTKYNTIILNKYSKLRFLESLDSLMPCVTERVT